MTTYAPPPARPSGPPPPRDTRPPSREPTHSLPGHAAWTGSIVAPVAAGAATLCAATALTGVIRGAEWFGHAMVAVVLVGCTGLAMRSIRAPALAVSFAQLVALLLLITGLYTSHGILGIIPGRSAFADLNRVLTDAGELIRESAPPVHGTVGILCLVTIGIGLVAVVVEALAVSLAAPAAAGLVLLCLYAVPASLADEMLPWWSFVLGAAAFAVLIAVEGNHRHRQWRGRGTTQQRSAARSALPAAVVAAALSLGLLAGATLTGIGTVGQLPFMHGGGSSSYSGGLGLRPMTELQGLLTDQGSTEIFRVEGLGDDERLMRAFTLDTYEPNLGWKLHDGEMPHGVPANAPLPRAPGDSAKTLRTVHINPVNWRDVWLPIIGHPRRITGIGDQWIYDEISGAVYAERTQRPKPYVLMTSLHQPTAEELRTAQLAADEVAPIYTELPELDPRVRDLTRRLVAGKYRPFDKAKAIWSYFIESGEFTYDVQTDDATGSDALTHFLLVGKRGFCAQFASAMAVMVRSEGIPARVAVGFTPGTKQGSYRSITTRDAHAWVEVYLGKEFGWVVFDPTPLAGGRGITPEYLQQQTSSSSSNVDPTTEPSPEPSAAPTSAPLPEDEQPDQPDTVQDQQVGLATAPGWARWSTVVVVLLAAAATGLGVMVARRTSQLRKEITRRELDEADQRLSAVGRWLPLAAAGGWLVSLGLLGWIVSWWLALLLMLVAGVASAPLVWRTVSRNRRLHELTVNRAQAPHAAWRELLDECADRGYPVGRAETVRETARKLADRFNLDTEGRAHLRVVVSTLERSWYGPQPEVDAEFVAAFEGLREAIHRNAPLALKDRIMPGSVVKR